MAAGARAEDGSAAALGKSAMDRALGPEREGSASARGVEAAKTADREAEEGGQPQAVGAARVGSAAGAAEGAKADHQLVEETTAVDARRTVTNAVHPLESALRPRKRTSLKLPLLRGRRHRPKLNLTRLPREARRIRLQRSERVHQQRMRMARQRKPRRPAPKAQTPTAPLNPS